MIINTTSGNGAYMGFKNSGSGATGYIGIDGFGYKNIDAGTLFLTTWTANNLILGTNTEERMRIASDGNITMKKNLTVDGLTTLSGGSSVEGYATFSGKIITNASAAAIGHVSSSQKIVLYPGDESNPPYGFGINANELYYSAPTTASHAFYCGTKVSGTRAFVRLGKYQTTGRNASGNGFISIQGDDGVDNYWTIGLSNADSDTTAGLTNRQYIGNLLFYAGANEVAWIEDGWSSSGRLQFTGQHRTISDNKNLYDKKYIGYIVSSEGQYKSINGKYKKKY
jgi:hypothetical protein